MACGLQYNPAVIRRHLSLQLALVLLLASIVPLAGAGLLTFHLIERSILEQVRASHEQLARASAALVRAYIQDAKTKLKNISRMIQPNEDPQLQTQRLNAQTDPPGIFLEVSYVKPRRAQPEVLSNAQTKEYAEVQSRNATRSLDTRLGQKVQQFTGQEPQIAVPAKGGDWVASGVEVVENLPSLACSVPAPGGHVLSAQLDFRPVSQILASVCGPDRRLILLVDRESKVLASSGDPASIDEPLEHGQPVGHGEWRILVREPRETAMAPVRHARRQAVPWLALAGVMALGLSALLGSRILSPVRALVRTADALGRGEFAARTGIAREDELGQLAEAFDRMAAAVQQLDQMKSDFVAHVSHELRTPLTSAKVALANVQEGISGREALARVQEDLDRLIRMVNALLDIARIEAGIELARQPADLGALVRSSVETLRPIARVELQVSGTGETLSLDSARVHQIVVNLVDNALKYAKARVEVAVEGREVRVTDDGPGVPPEVRERVFEKFSRVETGPKPPGVGLGLSIARKLALLHGGSLTCEGNTFVLRL